MPTHQSSDTEARARRIALIVAAVAVGGLIAAVLVSGLASNGGRTPEESAESPEPGAAKVTDSKAPAVSPPRVDPATQELLAAARTIQKQVARYRKKAAFSAPAGAAYEHAEAAIKFAEGGNLPKAREALEAARAKNEELQALRRLADQASAAIARCDDAVEDLDEDAERAVRCCGDEHPSASRYVNRLLYRDAVFVARIIKGEIAKQEKSVEAAWEDHRAGRFTEAMKTAASVQEAAGQLAQEVKASLGDFVEQRLAWHILADQTDSERLKRWDEQGWKEVAALVDGADKRASERHLAKGATMYREAMRRLADVQTAASRNEHDSLLKEATKLKGQKRYDEAFTLAGRALLAVPWSMKAAALRRELAAGVHLDTRPVLVTAAPVYSAAFLPGGDKILAVTGDDESAPTLCVLDAASGRQLRTLAEKLSGKVIRMRMSQDGKRVVCLTDKSYLMLWSIEDGKVLHQYGTGGANPAWKKAYDVAWLSDGRRMAVMCEGSGLVFDPATGPAPRPDYQVPEMCQHLDWDSIGQEHSSADAKNQEREGVVWLEQGGSFVSVGKDCSPDGELITMVMADSLFVVCDAASGLTVRRFRADDEKETERGFGWWNVVQSVFAPDGRRLVSCHDNGMLQVWDPYTGKRICGTVHQEYMMGGQTGYAPESVAFSPNGDFIVTESFFDVVLWDSITGRVVGRQERGGEGSVAFDATGSQIIVVNGTKDVRRLCIKRR